MKATKFDIFVKQVKVNPGSSIKHSLNSASPRCCIPRIKIIELLVLEKDFYHKRAWWTSWSCDLDHLFKVKSMQRPGTEAIRIQIQPSKPKQEITKITNSNTKIIYGQSSEQLFPKSWPLSNPKQSPRNGQ